jgi:hypothetical protein
MDLNDERQLRAWAIEMVLRNGGSEQKGVDFITAAQRIVDFVKGDGAARADEKV